MAFAAGGSAISIWQKFARRGKPSIFDLLEVTLKLGFRLNSDKFCLFRLLRGKIRNKTVFYK